MNNNQPITLESGGPKTQQAGKIAELRREIADKIISTGRVADQYPYWEGARDMLQWIDKWLDEHLPQPSHVSGSSEKEAMKIGYKAGCIHGQRVGTNEGVLEAFEIWYGKILEIRAGGTPEISMDMIPVYPKKRNVSDNHVAESHPEEKAPRDHILDNLLIGQKALTETILTLTKERDEYRAVLERYEGMESGFLAKQVLDEFRSK